MFGLGTMEIAVILFLGVLLFGSKLPQMGGYVAKCLREFQRTWRGLEDEVHGSLASPAREASRPPRRIGPSASTIAA